MRPNGQRPIRQGDVLLIPTDDVPAHRKVIEPENGRLILALGEATGHHHAIVLAKEAEAELYSVADEVDRWLRVQSPVALVHDEHAAIAVQQGGYIVRRQREYSPAEIHYVAD